MAELSLLILGLVYSCDILNSWIGTTLSPPDVNGLDFC